MKINNIESKTIVFKEPIDIWVMCDERVEDEIQGVKKIVETIDTDGDTLAEFFDDNMEFINNIFVVGSRYYYIP